MNLLEKIFSSPPKPRMQEQCPSMSVIYDQSENEMLHYLSSPLLPLNESSSRTLQVHDIQDDLASVRRRNHEIVDTGDLSQVEL